MKAHWPSSDPADHEMVETFLCPEIYDMLIASSIISRCLRHRRFYQYVLVYGICNIFSRNLDVRQVLARKVDVYRVAEIKLLHQLGKAT